MGKPDSKQEWMDKKQSKENSKNQNEMLEVKNTVNDFNGLIRRLDTAKEKNISQFEDVSTENSQIAKQKIKRLKRKQMPEHNIQEQ